MSHSGYLINQLTSERLISSVGCNSFTETDTWEGRQVPMSHEWHNEYNTYSFGKKKLLRRYKRTWKLLSRMGRDLRDKKKPHNIFFTSGQVKNHCLSMREWI